MTQFSISKKNGLLDLQGLQMLISFMMGMRNGEYSLIIQQRRQKRSSKQNNWLWGVIYPVLRQALVQKGWEFADDDQVHEFLKDRICRQSVVNRHTGETISFPDSTSDMDTVQFSTYCQRIIDIAAEYLGVDVSKLLPDPEYLKKEDEILSAATSGAQDAQRAQPSFRERDAERT